MRHASLVIDPTHVIQRQTQSPPISASATRADMQPNIGVAATAIRQRKGHQHDRLLLCLVPRSSWLTVEGDRQIAAAGLLHRRGDGHPWPCRSAWLLAFRRSSVR